LRINDPHSHFSLSKDSANNTALNILNERFVKGEIEEEEYTKKRILTKL